MTVLTSVSRLIAGLLLLAGCFALAAPVAPVKAAGLEGTKTIYLVDNAGEEREIGTATFSKADGAVSITIALDQGRFSEKFLSMRPFRCIDGPKQTACHLPYPYELKDRITPEDLSDLEYRLLFLHKGPTDYGIDAWNGLYYKFELAADGTLKGKLHEADFNVLAVPPAQAFSKPIGPADLVPGEEGRHRFPSLTIR
ncbi:MAG: hypothetical protein KJ587_18905 [Alphaproteobacteria bacterium]|nr:hypothetical protein [Alphaproteobacteria bacterium]